MIPSRGSRASPMITKRALCSTGSRKVTTSSPFFISQSATIAPGHLVDRDFFRQLNFHFASCALHDVETRLRVNGRRIFGEARQLCERSAHPQRQFDVMIFRLLPPREASALRCRAHTPAIWSRSASRIFPRAIHRQLSDQSPAAEAATDARVTPESVEGRDMLSSPAEDCDRNIDIELQHPASRVRQAAPKDGPPFALWRPAPAKRACPSSCASRTSNPAGTGTRTQPSFNTSTVRLARPAARSPLTCRS